MGSNLGKGLSALFDEIQDDSHIELHLNKSRMILINNIKPNPYQPRRFFDEEGLETLSQSISENGLLQPIIVRFKDPHYQIIAGERRYRASKKAGLLEICAIIRECSDQELLGLALAENLQREDLNPIEEAQSIYRLISDYDKTQEDVAQIINKSRSYVANLLRLLTLSEEIQDFVRRKQISPGHARTLINSLDPKKLIKRIIDENLTVRELEKIVRLQKEQVSQKQKGICNSNYVQKVKKITYEQTLEKKDISAQSLPNNESKNDIDSLSFELSQKLGLKVSIDLKSNQKGIIAISFDTYDDLDHLLNIFQNVILT